MKSYSVITLASLLSLAAAAPANKRDAPACVVVTTSTPVCTVITTTVLATDVASVLSANPSATVTTSAVAGK